MKVGNINRERGAVGSNSNFEDTKAKIKQAVSGQNISADLINKVENEANFTQEQTLELLELITNQFPPNDRLPLTCQIRDLISQLDDPTEFRGKQAKEKLLLALTILVKTPLDFDRFMLDSSETGKEFLTNICYPSTITSQDDPYFSIRQTLTNEVSKKIFFQDISMLIESAIVDNQYNSITQQTHDVTQLQAQFVSLQYDPVLVPRLIVAMVRSSNQPHPNLIKVITALEITKYNHLIQQIAYNQILTTDVIDQQALWKIQMLVNLYMCNTDGADQVIKFIDEKYPNHNGYIKVILEGVIGSVSMFNCILSKSYGSNILTGR